MDEGRQDWDLARKGPCLSCPWLSFSLQASHLLHTLALGHILVSHTNPGVQKTFEEVSTADPHQVGSLVSTWREHSLDKEEEGQAFGAGGGGESVVTEWD